MNGLQHLRLLYSKLLPQPRGRHGTVEQDGHRLLHRVYGQPLSACLGQQLLDGQRPGQVVGGGGQVSEVGVHLVT